LFAERDYEKGEFVAEYGGRILSWDEAEDKDQSYFRVIGIDKHNGIIDGKYDFGDTLGRYINTPMKGKHPNCRWYEFNQKTQTITIKTNKEVKCGQEFTIRYSPPIRDALQEKKKRGRPPNKK
jgi:SET domain-containing protein